MPTFDLSLVPFDDIYTELSKRFELLAIAFVHNPEGSKVAETRYGWNTKTGRDTDILGLTETMSAMVRNKILAGLTISAAGSQLDRPMPPPMKPG